MLDATTAPTGLFTDDSHVTRCVWCRSTLAYQQYHDHEWGMPVSDDRRLLEKICLEGFQAGLSWLTILNKREGFRLAFAGFDMDRVAAFDDSDVKRLLLDAGIVRHRAKIASTINNARRAQELRQEFGTLASYFWQFEPDVATRPSQITHQTLMGVSTSAQSIAMSKDLRKRGWSFVGPTTMYAFMQATGLVNDHIEGCAARRRVTSARLEVNRSSRLAGVEQLEEMKSSTSVDGWPSRSGTMTSTGSSFTASRAVASCPPACGRCQLS